MLRAIHSLNTGAEIIGSGNLDHRITIETHDELGGLAVSFNKMTTSLKETNDDLQSFIFSLSHDLRSPLVTIKGFSGELAYTLREHEKNLEQCMTQLYEDDRKRVLEVLRTDIPETLEYIETATDKMSDLVNGVLKLSRVGQIPLKPQALDMEALVRTVAARHEGEIQRKNVSVRIEHLPTIMADRVALQEIVENLLDNAVKYLVSDRPGVVEITSQQSDKETVFFVSDNGRGITKEDAAKVFGLFRRAGQQDIHGAGMGLAYVKALVRRHGGRIWCESEVGVGTTFKFSIPVTVPIA